jgi:hypothetical protein
VEPEEEVDEDEKGPYILQSEVEKAIKEMRDKKATGDDDVPGDVLKLLGEDGLNLMTTDQQRICNWEVAQRFYRSYNDCLKEEAQSYKVQHHRTVSIITHAAKIVSRILRRRIEREIQDVLGEDQFGFRRGKGTRDAIGMLRIISERTLDIDE